MSQPQLAVTPASKAEGDLSRVVLAWQGLRPADGAAIAVQNLEIVSGHLRIVLKSGRAVPVLVAGEQIGIFFKGQGSYEYQSTDPIEFPIMSFNIKKATGLGSEMAGGALKVADRFETLLFVAAGRAVPELKGAPAGSLADEFRAHVDYFTRAAGPPPSHLFAIQKLDAPEAGVARAEIGGGKEDVVHVLDPILSRSETLYALLKSGSDDREMRRRLLRVVLSDQPIGRDRRDTPLPRFLLGDVDYTLVASDGKEATLSVTETLVPVERPMSVFQFDLYSVTYNVVGTGKLEPRHFRVKSVMDDSGRGLSFHHENDELVVAFPAKVPARQPVKVKFEIDGDFLIRPHGDNFWQLGVEPWFPQPDLGEQAYTLHSLVKVKKPFIPFAPGATLARRAEGDYNVVENRIDQPVQFAVVHAGKYEFSEETRGGVTVRVASYAARNERAWKQLTNLAYGIMEYYQNFLGPFPFTEFNIIEVNEYGYGQAPPGTMFITKEAFQSRIGDLNQIFSKGVNERFAHEIAHQYWGVVVKMPSLEEQWLTESFAEYSAALFLRKYEGKPVYDSLVATWKSNAKEAREVSPIPLANRITIKDDPFRAFIMRTYLIYDKGAFVLSRIHAQMDDKVFMTFLKSYQKNFRWKFGSTKHVAGLLQVLTGKDYGPFFEGSYWGTAMPD